MRIAISFLSVALLSPLAGAQEIDRGRVVPLAQDLEVRCLRVLREGLAGNDFWPAMHAAEALTLAGRGGEVAAALWLRMPNEDDPQHRCGLIREIVRTGDKRPLEEMFRILADMQSTGRVHAAESLYKVNQIGDGRALREAFTQTANLRLQLMSAAALARRGDRAALDFLRAHVTHEDVEMRKIAAWVLGVLGDASDVDPLRRGLLREKDPLAQAYFVNALACLGDAAARTRLVTNLSSPEPAIRTYAAEFAGYSRTVEARPKLLELLSDAALDVRVRSAQSLIAFSLERNALPLAR